MKENLYSIDKDLAQLVTRKGNKNELESRYGWERVRRFRRRRGVSIIFDF